MWELTLVRFLRQWLNVTAVKLNLLKCMRITENYIMGAWKISWISFQLTNIFYFFSFFAQQRYRAYAILLKSSLIGNVTPCMSKIFTPLWRILHFHPTHNLSPPTGTVVLYSAEWQNSILSLLELHCSVILKSLHTPAHLDRAPRRLVLTLHLHFSGYPRHCMSFNRSVSCS